MNRNIFIIGLALLGTGAMNAFMVDVDPSTLATSTTDVAAEEADSISPAEAALQKAIESYTKLRALKQSGAGDEVLFPEVYSCYTDNMEALNLAEPRSSAWQRCKGMLRDINPDLEEGAFYYSGINNSAELARFARAYIDTQLHEAFKGETFRHDERSFPSIVYCAASGAYNAKEYDKSIEYFKLYFSTGEEKLREQIFMFMGQACINTGNYDLAVTSMQEGMKAYPANYQLVQMGIKACTDGGHAEALQPFLEKALALNPNDEQILNIQGKLYEDEQEYQKALEIYDRLDQMKPNSMQIAKHTALCYYNLGVSFFNKAILEQDEKAAKRYNRQAKSYFGGATEKLETIVANDPMSVKYLKALAVSYGCMDNTEKFDEINTRIQALGESPMANFNMPPVMAYSDDNSRNFGRDDSAVASSNSIEAPLYSEFASGYVTERLGKWAKKGEFERIEDFNKRVNDGTIKAEYDRLCKEAQDEYLGKYASRLRLNDLTLQPYDTDNEVYLINSSYGPIYLNVPLKNNEAEMFKAGWAGMQFRNPKYYIKDDQVLIGSITFTTPGGKSYTYNSSDDINYAYTRVKVDFDRIIDSNTQGPANTPAYTDVTITKKSDVDENIPSTGHKAPSTLAVIIANENYANVSKVPSALHDGEVFRQYCNLTLGLPEENIRIYKDATLGSMLRAIAEIKNTVGSFNGNADVIVYYAGHGMPDDATKDAFLLPVDGDATMTESCYSLDKFYKELGGMNAKSVMVFLDACFSGSQRDGSMLVSARGVAIKPKEAAPKGNMFTLSATSGQETALPYKEKNHGLFTYYLLKKLQDTKGNVTLKDLSDDVINNVKKQSNLINQKPQTPQVSVSGAMTDSWGRKKLRE